MGKKKKEIIRIIRTDTNKEDYTFVSDDNVLNNVNSIKNNELATTTNNDKKFENKPNDILKKKVHSKKADNKGRKTLGKSLQGLFHQYMNNQIVK